MLLYSIDITVFYDISFSMLDSLRKSIPTAKGLLSAYIKYSFCMYNDLIKIACELGMKNLTLICQS